MDANLVNMEETLIEEVKKRPYIYDRSMTVYKNKKLREQAWKEVAQAVKLRDIEVAKKRWRSLRDSFIKIQRSLKNNPHQVKIKWVYYKQLEFLLPHIEHREDKSLDELFIKEDEDENSQEEHDFQNFSSEEVFSESSSNSQSKTEALCNNNNKRRKTVNDEDPLVSTTRDVDSDEQFLLSCLPALKRLQPRENAIARMRIQQVLFQVEFGGSEESRFLTKEEVIDS